MLTYRELSARRVDLVGDYAGKEIFLIDGDSLLLRCFDDRNLDFEHGFQLLHAVYNVESFLHQLKLRHCNFAIVFFDCNERLCVPDFASSAQEPKYLLARAAVIRHLTALLRQRDSDITISLFESWTSPAFVQYLKNTSPYFLMAHDGAQSTNTPMDGAQLDAEKVQSDEQRTDLRNMILSFIAQGFNIALVNELTWHDSKVMTTVLESRRRANVSQPPAKEIIPPETVRDENVAGILQEIRRNADDLDERQLLAVVVISKLLVSMPSDVSSQEWISLCRDFLSHQAVLAHIPLSKRRFEQTIASESECQFLAVAASLSTAVLKDSSWSAEMLKGTTTCNIADYVDGRIFLEVAHDKLVLSENMQQTFATLHAAVKSIVSPDTSARPGKQSQSNGHVLEGAAAIKTGATTDHSTVLPFSNPVFDKHLERVRLDVDASALTKQTLASRKVFTEISHWHNSTKPLVRKGPPVPVDAWRAKKAASRDQRLMAEIQKYAASLTNAVGKALDPETIISGQQKEIVKPSKSESPTAPQAAKGKQVGKKGGGAKTAAKNATKTAMLNQQAEEQAKRTVAAEDKILAAWKVTRQNIDIATNPRERYRRAQVYLGNLQPAIRDVVGTECEIYMINSLLDLWKKICRAGQQSQNLHVAALIWSHLQNVSKSRDMPKSVAQYIASVIKLMELPPVLPGYESTLDKKLSISLDLPDKDQLQITTNEQDFQLSHCGHFFERSFDSKEDPRVDFHPDDWQRRVLDSIDDDRSVFVVAPTSAGKTFISFYAMHKVLAADDDGILVYVAPTKALVNQIAAEIQARYSKSFKHGGRSVWAIHTRDYRINSPNGCQVLVTVPHVLQIMLLAPSNAKSWSGKIKRVIFDEIHSIGQAEDGVVWEQLLLMTPCPIIALSATVGNPDEFAQWLASTQDAIGKQLDTIEHPYRYSDLRKFYYVQPKNFSFAGLSEATPLSNLSLDALPGLNYIHPVAALVDRTRGIPDDLALEPRDCLYLWRGMKKLETADYPVSSGLDPEKALPKVPRKQDILTWEGKLKSLLQTWLVDPASPFEPLLLDLGKEFNDETQEDKYLTNLQNDGSEQELQSADDLLETTLPLLCRLQERNALPAILFNYDRHQCEKICAALLEKLTTAEETQVKSGSKWEKQLARWEEWKTLSAKLAKKGAAMSQKKPGKKSKDEAGDADKLTKADIQQDSGSTEDEKWLRFNPEAPMDGYHFADFTKLQASELAEYVRELRYREIQPWLIQALERGIGVHHAGMNRKYRQVVEILFRKRFLRVVIATGTLALGINMPCKTVVFSGDSVFLTALNYRQCAGRAGRRGFDLLGNIVFHGISRQKVCRLISSRLPSLTGHFPITTSFVLRLFSLLHESNGSKYAVTAINSVLSQPRLYMGGESFRDQAMHHLRFSIDYLRRQHLLDSDGAPINLAGLVSHLYYTENSSFAFHALFKEGYFNTICADVTKSPKETMETLMLVLSHLFGRIQCRRSDAEFQSEVIKKSSSMVFLPPLPAEAETILQDHNKQTLDIYWTYVRTFADQHITYDDNTLPLTGVKYGGSDAAVSATSLEPTRVRSSFVALSGLGDTFESIHDLCSTVRSGVFLEEAVIPFMQVYNKKTDVPLNAWLLDFFRHGDVMTLERDNGIRRSDVWFHLNDFSLVLATIVTSLTNYMKLSNSGDVDMLDLQGGMDTFEEARDDEAGNAMEGDEGKKETTRTGVKPIVVAAMKKKKQKVLASWDDEEVEDEKAQSDTDAGDTEDDLAEQLESWSVEEDGGLPNVLKAFQKLQAEFNEKFKAMWA